MLHHAAFMLNPALMQAGVRTERSVDDEAPDAGAHGGGRGAHHQAAPLRITQVHRE